LELEDAESYVPGEPTRLPVDIAKSAMKQMIQGLAYLHGKGITHGDLQPGNVLITVDHAEQGLIPKLRSGEQSPMIPVQRRDGKQDLWAPKYLVLSRPFTKFSEFSAQSNVRIGDLGACEPSSAHTIRAILF